MKVFIARGQSGRVQVQVRPEGEGAIGDLTRILEPGKPDETFFGWTCEELRPLGNGEHELEPKD